MNGVFNRRNLFLSLFTLVCISLFAQIPSGYYSRAKDKKERELKTALAGIIRSHTERTYKELWSDFRSTDQTASGTVWDMYSSVTKFTFVKDQCGNYGSEGDCYNREHSFPKSWFDDQAPMYTDLYHLYPTDGYVNNRRGNYPFGETSSPSYTSSGGFSRLGKSSSPGYSDIVFEPNDEYKGDFARTYFYMVTCYENNVSSWNSPMLAHNKYPAFDTWAVNLLLKWCREDPVSKKEKDRNEAVYKIQHNRNPFIDFPGLEELIWGNRTNDAFDPDGYAGISGVTSRFGVYTQSGKLSIETDQRIQVKIVDILGRCVREMTVEPGTTEVNLPAGIYLVNGKKVVI